MQVGMAGILEQKKFGAGRAFGARPSASFGEVDLISILAELRRANFLILVSAAATLPGILASQGAIAGQERRFITDFPGLRNHLNFGFYWVGALGPALGSTIKRLEGEIGLRRENERKMRGRSVATEVCRFHQF